MASSLETIIVPAKGAHTATVIFLHVCRYRVLSAPPSDAQFFTGTGRFWTRLEANC